MKRHQTTNRSGRQRSRHLPISNIHGHSAALILAFPRSVVLRLALCRSMHIWNRFKSICPLPTMKTSGSDYDDHDEPTKTQANKAKLINKKDFPFSWIISFDFCACAVRLLRLYTILRLFFWELTQVYTNRHMTTTIWLMLGHQQLDHYVVVVCFNKSFSILMQRIYDSPIFFVRTALCNIHRHTRAIDVNSTFRLWRGVAYVMWVALQIYMVYLLLENRTQNGSEALSLTENVFYTV